MLLSLLFLLIVIQYYVVAIKLHSNDYIYKTELFLDLIPLLFYIRGAYEIGCTIINNLIRLLKD